MLRWRTGAAGQNFFSPFLLHWRRRSENSSLAMRLRPSVNLLPDFSSFFPLPLPHSPALRRRLVRIITMKDVRTAEREISRSRHDLKNTPFRRLFFFLPSFLFSLLSGWILAAEEVRNPCQLQQGVCSRPIQFPPFFFFFLFSPSSASPRSGRRKRKKDKTASRAFRLRSSSFFFSFFFGCVADS